MAFSANIATIDSTNNGINAIDKVDKSAKIDVDKNIVNVQDYVKDDKRLQLLSENFNALEQNFSNAEVNSEIQNLLNNLLQNAYQEDEVVNSLIVAKQHGQQKLLIKLTKQNIKLSIGNLTTNENKSNKRLYVQKKLYVSIDQKLQLFLL